MSNSGCGDGCATQGGGCSSSGCGADPRDARLASQVGRIKNKLVVLSGKGGVGKSSVAANIAVALALAGKKVGLLDVDVHGPSIPRLLSLSEQKPHVETDSMEPVAWSKNLSVMSLGFLLPSPEEAVIWRGPMKMGLIKQFMSDVTWGDLDFLIVDCPPGTGDEPLSALQTVGPDAQAVIVTTPQGLAVDDVRRSVTFCRQVGNPVFGVVENMSGFVCPDCGKRHDIFNTGGGERLAQEMGVRFLGAIPMDPEMVRAADEGYPFMKVHHHGPTAEALNTIIKPMLEMTGSLQETPGGSQELPTLEDIPSRNGTARIAVPVAQGKLCLHFGHCEQFALVDVNLEDKTIADITLENPPPHEPGVLPAWCADQGVNLVLAGGMGSRAQSLFTDRGVKVLVGAPSEEPEAVVRKFLEGSLQLGSNTCDH
jgi:Mrp family chromosome partitioning ATPase/predicted Fe-Mo cluster-binding NifX family protein